jgi:hypothetical protein
MHLQSSWGPRKATERLLAGDSRRHPRRRQLAASVSSQSSREAVFRCESMAGQWQVSAAMGNSHSRPSAVVDRHRLTDWPTASDWVLPFDLALPKVTCCRKLTPISRPGSRTKSGLRIFDASNHHSLAPPSASAVSIAPVFSLGRLRTESRQTPIGIKRVALLSDRPGGVCRPRETLVPSRVHGDHIAYGCGRGEATPVRDWLMAWAIG